MAPFLRLTKTARRKLARIESENQVDKKDSHYRLYYQKEGLVFVQSHGWLVGNFVDVLLGQWKLSTRFVWNWFRFGHPPKHLGCAQFILLHAREMR